MSYGSNLGRFATLQHTCRETVTKYHHKQLQIEDNMDSRKSHGIQNVERFKSDGGYKYFDKDLQTFFGDVLLKPQCEQGFVGLEQVTNGSNTACDKVVFNNMQLSRKLFFNE